MVSHKNVRVFFDIRNHFVDSWVMVEPREITNASKKLIIIEYTMVGAIFLQMRKTFVDNAINKF